MSQGENIDYETVDGFGNEWARFDQSNLSREENHRLLFRSSGTVLKEG